MFIDPVNQLTPAARRLGRQRELPLRCTANGKAYLAGLGTAAVARLSARLRTAHAAHDHAAQGTAQRSQISPQDRGRLDREEHTRESAPPASSP